jgi:hypothetical protein
MDNKLKGGTKTVEQKLVENKYVGGKDDNNKKYLEHNDDKTVDCKRMYESEVFLLLSLKPESNIMQGLKG